MEKAVGGHQAFGVRRSCSCVAVCRKGVSTKIEAPSRNCPSAQRVEGAHRALRTRADIAARPAPGRDRVRVRQLPDLTEAKDRPDLALNWVYDPDLFAARGDARPPPIAPRVAGWISEGAQEMVIRATCAFPGSRRMSRLTWVLHLLQPANGTR
jgi:hypothetical protein